MKTKLNTDIFYDYYANEMTYHLEDEQGNVIFNGKSYKNPKAEYININISKICRDYMNNTLPDFRDYEDDTYSHPNAYRTFRLYVDELPSGGEDYVPVLKETYDMLFIWSNKEWEGESITLSEPINGHMSPDMKLLYTVYKETTGETICWEEILEPIFSYNPTSLNFSYEESRRGITVDSNMEYTALSDASWLSVTPVRASTGWTTFIVIAQAQESVDDPARDGHITFQTNRGYSYSVPVHQEKMKPVFFYNPKKLNFNYAASSSKISVSPNMEYTTSSDAPWLTFTPAVATTGQTTFTINVRAQEIGEPARDGHITFQTNKGYSYSVPVHQEKKEPIFIYSPERLNFEGAAASSKITVSSNMEYTISSNASWLTFTPTVASTGQTVFTINVEAQELDDPARDGYITFNTEEGKTYTVPVHQERFIPVFDFSPSSLNFEAVASMSNIRINSNMAYTVSSDSNWLRVSPSSGGMGKTIVVVNAEAQTSARKPARNGNITFTTDRGFTYTLPVFQNKVTGYYVEAEPTPLVFGMFESGKTLAVYSNTDWTVENHNDWLTLDKTSGSGDDSIELTVSGFVDDGRSGNIILRTATKSFVVPVRQISLDPDKYILLSCADGNVFGEVLERHIYNTEADWDGNLVFEYSYPLNLGTSWNQNIFISEFSNILTKLPSNPFISREDTWYIELPDSITEIEDGALRMNASYYPGLGTLYFGRSVNKIGDNITNVVDNIVFEGTTEPVYTSSSPFYGISGTTGTLYYPQGSDYSNTISFLPEEWDKVEYNDDYMIYYYCDVFYRKITTNYYEKYFLDTYNHIEDKRMLMYKDKVREIKDFGFAYDSHLSYISLPKTITKIGRSAFYLARKLKDFYYRGTMAQWNNITKGSGWKGSAPFTVVHCSDGDVAV